jgi:uncharacterized protein YkwD
MWQRLSAVLLAISVTAGVAPASAQDGATALAERSLALTNEARADHGLDPLSLDPTLTEAARVHARDMLRNDYFSHVSPDGRDVVDRFTAAGGSRWLAVAENIAACRQCASDPTVDDVERFHEGWMDSEGHRENILAPGYDRYGFAIAAANGRQYAVQTFAGPGIPRGTGGGTAGQGEPVTAAQAQEAALEIVNARRRDRGLDPLAASDTLRQAAAQAVGDVANADPQAALSAVPRSARIEFGEFYALVGQCGGCGAEPVRGDVSAFIEDWLRQGGDTRLLSPQATHLGFALNADGEGRKAAAAVIGMGR